LDAYAQAQIGIGSIRFEQGDTVEDPFRLRVVCFCFVSPFPPLLAFLLFSLHQEKRAVQEGSVRAFHSELACFWCFSCRQDSSVLVHLGRLQWLAIL
jgi:hypothetical protein